MRLLLLLVTLIPALGHAEQTVQIPGPEGITLTAKLFPAEGPELGASIVALHGCSGPYPSRDHTWARQLAAAGHTVLLPDSFGSRGLMSQCGIPPAQRVANATGLRLADALAALHWLAAQPGTPPGGLVLMGWSDGATTVLTTGGSPDLPDGLVRGLVAFYPGCRPALNATGWRPAAPLLILVGEADDWTGAAPCRELAAKAPALKLVSYPGAYHDFDVPHRDVKLRATASGEAHTGTDPAAREDALLRVPAFIAALPATAWPSPPSMIQAHTLHEAAP